MLLLTQKTIVEGIREIQKFGLREVLMHALFTIDHSMDYKTKMALERAKYYDRLNAQQIRREIAELYKKKIGYSLDIDTPTAFTEKIQWLKIYDCTAVKTRLSDKLLVREWIKEKTPELRHIPLIEVWKRPEEIDFDALPESFCLKMNHGSGMNYVVKDKSTEDAQAVKRLFASWFCYPFHITSLELHYRDIPRRILAEKYMEEVNGGLYDYKIHCFNGKPTFIQCIGDRNLKDHSGYQMNFDTNWSKMDWTFEDYPVFPYMVPKPECLSEMLSIAKRLSERFSYVRVDLYEISGEVYFGEMTFTPASGIYPYKGTWTREKDLELGKCLQLPDK